MKEAFMKEEVSLIHCSAGVGRTGTLLAILHKQLYPTTEVFRVVQNLRKHRMGMVQTVEQYGLISKFISHLLK
jgi:protein-tyrosine phosphatase